MMEEDEEAMLSSTFTLPPIAVYLPLTGNDHWLFDAEEEWPHCV